MKKIPGFIRRLLQLFSGLYGLISEIRNLLYDHRYLKIRKYPILIISVGNLTVGGTGKTPFVIFLARYITGLSSKVGIVTRGYGRKTKGMVIVHDGKSMLATPGEGGDEPCMMAAALKSVPVISDEKRWRGIREMMFHFKVKVVILDDAYQHRRIARDLNILLVNAREPAENYHLLPAGRLRESLKQSRRADLIVYTKCTDYALPGISSELANFASCPQITVMTDYTLFQIINGKLHPAKRPLNEPVFAFCGIGDPDSFRQALSETDISPLRLVIFRDHQKYSGSVVNKLESQIREAQCHAVITTEKDSVKLPRLFLESFSIYIIRIAIKPDKKSQRILTNHIRDLVI